MWRRRQTAVEQWLIINQHHNMWIRTPCVTVGVFLPMPTTTLVLCVGFKPGDVCHRLHQPALMRAMWTGLSRFWFWRSTFPQSDCCLYCLFDWGGGGGERVFCARLINKHGRAKKGDSDLDNKKRKNLSAHLQRAADSC